MPVLKVKDNNGQWVKATTVNQIDYEYVIEPLEIDANGTYTAPAHIDGYSPIVVNVPIPEPEVKEPVIEELTITENGTYEVPADVDGFGPVIVNVPVGETIEIPPITGNCNDMFLDGKWDFFVTCFGDKIITSEITSASQMFKGSKLEAIPFVLNFSSESAKSVNGIFMNCINLKSLPSGNFKPNSIDFLFYSCNRLREVPADYFDSWDFSYMKSLTGGNPGYYNDLFTYCYSLRSFPISIFENINPYVEYNKSFYQEFYSCYALDELVDLPIYHKGTWAANAFFQAFTDCYRLKNITFAMPDGQPYVMNWKSQIIDLSGNTGYGSNKVNILNYNSGITADKEVRDDTTYVALKDDPDWFTCNMAYSRYNHDSAVATINSLPDTSAYLATSGGTNTIKFRGVAGRATDGGAINTLTEAEIAVAMAKGWTVSLV